MTKTEKCVGYVRYSSVSQAGESDATQRQIIEQYAKEKNLHLVEIISDPATSGKTKFLKRPGGQRLNEMLCNGDATAVIVTRIDRPWRNLIDCLLTLDEWHRRDVAAHIVSWNHGKPLDTSQPLERMMVSMLGIFAEFERGQLGQRVVEALKSRRARGMAWNHAPYGKRSQNGKLVEAGDEMRVLNRVLDLHAQGLNPTAIAKTLEREGFTNRKGLVKFQCHQIQRYLLLNGQRKAG